MATPINDAYQDAATSGVKRVASDGESVDMHSLDELRRAAEIETKQENAGKKRLGIKMYRVRPGGAAPQ